MANEQALKGVEIHDGTFILKVTKDRLQAVVTPKDMKANAKLDPERLARELKENNIEAVLLADLEPVGAGSLCVAKGVPPIQGENSKAKMHVKPAMVHVPKRKDASTDMVDFRELGSIVNVAKDRLLLEKIPPTPGEAGKDVFGAAIPAKPGKDRKLKYGKGVYLSENEMKVFSSLDGKFVMAEGKPSVHAEHIISGDVDLKVGNIAFAGSHITVNGEVLPGFNVKCRGDITIRQGVNNGFLMAGGNLAISGGVVGEDSVLRAKGDINVDFVENGPKIETASSLFVNDFLVQTEAKVGKNILATKGKGTIIGGKFTIAGSMHVKELGSDAEVITDISVGIVPSLQAKKQQLDEDMQLWSDRMNEIIKNISALEKMKKEGGGKLPEDKAALLTKCQTAMPKAMDKVNQLTESSAALEEDLERMVNECVYVYGTLYPGVIVRLGNVSRTISLEEQQVVVTFDKSSQQILVRKMTDKERNEMPANY